jgi:hypothetical protein
MSRGESITLQIEEEASYELGFKTFKPFNSFKTFIGTFGTIGTNTLKIQTITRDRRGLLLGRIRHPV